MNLASECKMKKTISRYLEKNIMYPQLIERSIKNEVGIIVVIPCFDEPDVVSSVLSIANCSPPEVHVEVIVSINAGEQDGAEIKAQNQKSYDDLIALDAKLPSWMVVHPIMNNELPTKKAGVGLGRKIGMDEAVRRFATIEKENGIILCYDADSLCEQNYLSEVEAHFKNGTVQSASINFEHPIEGDSYSLEIYKSIVQYELHLRYFIDVQKKIRLPFAFHTVGSSMACTVSAYCAVGGMNQRKAGEDFYFIHKLVKFGKHSELNTTKVIPSPRISDRVPFGTGRAIGTMRESEVEVYETYHPNSFRDLSVMVDAMDSIFANKSFPKALPDSLQRFLDAQKSDHELDRIFQNTTDFNSFKKMFWHWFDAFVLMKYLHYGRDHFYPNVPVLQAVNMEEEQEFSTAEKALNWYRLKSHYL